MSPEDLEAKLALIPEPPEGETVLAVMPPGEVEIGPEAITAEVPKSSHAGYLPPHHFLGGVALTERELTQGYTAGGYYFWDETEAHVCGPYGHIDVALEAQKAYGRFLQDGSQPDLRTTIEVARSQESLSLVTVKQFGSKAEFCGRFCSLCNNTTPHFRPRGRSPDYVKKVPWLCSPCLSPGGALYEIVRCLMVRQGEIAP